MSNITPPCVACKFIEKLQSITKQYLNYIGKSITWLNTLSHNERLCLAWLYWDYVCAVIKHRCLIRQYVIGEFWKLSNPERKKRLTYHRIVKLFNKYNNPKYIHYLNEKSDFNTFFNDFVHRGWLYIRNITENEFVAFLKKYNEVIIKPVDGVEGNGIRKFRISGHSAEDLSRLYTDLCKENVLVEQVIRQHPRMEFGNTSVNTIRTHTILDSRGKHMS